MGLKRVLSKYELYIMGFICFAFILVFYYLPLGGWIIAFSNYRPGMKILDMEFVGLKHFITTLGLSGVRDSFQNTMFFFVYGLFTTPFAPFFAILLSEIPFKKITRVFQTVTTFPHFISWILVFSVFFAMLAPSTGMINVVFTRLGLITSPINPIGNADIVYLFQTSVGVWKSLGFSAIIYLAALSGIDPGLYEAADIDGASRFRKILHIKIPGLLPTYIVLLTLNIGGMLGAGGFEQPFVFQNPITLRKITTLDYYIYQLGMLRVGGSNYAFATAIGMLRSLISIVLLLTANFVSKRIRGASIL